MMGRFVILIITYFGFVQAPYDIGISFYSRPLRPLPYWNGRKCNQDEVWDYFLKACTKGPQVPSTKAENPFYYDDVEER